MSKVMGMLEIERAIVPGRDKIITEDGEHEVITNYVGAGEFRFKHADDGRECSCYIESITGAIIDGKKVMMDRSRP